MTFSVVVAAALLAAQTSAPAQSPTDKVGQAYYLFIQGRLLDGQDDLAGAIASYRQAIELLPQAPDIHAELAGLFLRQGQAADAKTEADAALAVDPTNAEGHRVLGWIGASAVQRLPQTSTSPLIGETIGHLEKSMGVGVPDPATQLTLGQLYLRNNQPAKAVDMLRQFLLDRPTYPLGLTLLAQAYDASGQPAEAARIRSDLRKSQPATLDARAGEIERLERQGQWKDAAAAWADLIRANPAAGAPFRIRYAAALASSGDYAAASGVLDQVTKDTPSDITAWYLLAQVEQRAGQTAAAEQAAAHIARIDPKDPRGPMALADLRATRRDYRGVVQALESRVTTPSAEDVGSGAYAQMARQLSAAFAQLNDHKRAIDVLEDARKRLPEDRDVEFALASAYEQDHRFDQAERAFRAMIAADAQNAQALNYLGYMFAERGKNLDEAVSLVTRALAIDDGNPSYLDSLGWAYFKLQQLDKAREPLERAANALPNVSVIQDHLGDVYFEMKRYGDATAAFDHALSGDRDGIDSAVITKKRDRARSLAGKP